MNDRLRRPRSKTVDPPDPTRITTAEIHASTGARVMLAEGKRKESHLRIVTAPRNHFNHKYQVSPDTKPDESDMA